ncbi:MAG: cysteine desulfurase family protein [Verrucomicrobiota bacterium]
MERIYLDYNASTPIADEVIAAMQPFLAGNFGNPSSGHWASELLRPSIENARNQIADTIGSKSSEIVFTGSGTEASNLAIKGLFFEDWGRPFHVITTSVEHAATLAPCRFVETLGAEVTVLPVDGTGQVDPAAVEQAIKPHTKLVSVMHAQNEVGTIQPIDEIGRLTRERGICFHVDAAQSVGKIPVDVEAMNADLLSLTGQKIYGPKGVGALYIREGVTLSPLIHGPTAHERGLRAGTECAALNVALGRACSLIQEKEMGMDDRSRLLRDRLREGLMAAFGERILLNGHVKEGLPNTLNVSFLDFTGSDLLAKCPVIAASVGSACHSGSHSVSPTLEAMGVEEKTALGAIRFSVGRYTTEDEIDEAIDVLGLVRE